ncbi:MAG: hypothetical protein H7829_14310 [Magnetococcus sp. THC-1_WYH]
MATIALMTPENATGSVAEIYRQVEQKWGGIPMPLQLWGVSPFLLEGQMRTIGYLMQHPQLDVSMLNLLRYLVARGEECHFCIDFNQARLLDSGWTLEQIQGAQADLSITPLAEKQKVMLGLILKAVLHRKPLSAEDVAMAKGHGFSEQDLLEGVFAGILAQGVDRLIDSFSADAG